MCRFLASTLLYISMAFGFILTPSIPVSASTLLEKVKQDPNKYFEQISCQESIRSNESLPSFEVNPGIIAFIDLTSSSPSEIFDIEILVRLKNKKYYPALKSQAQQGGFTYFNSKYDLTEPQNLTIKYSLKNTKKSSVKPESYKVRIVSAQPKSEFHLKT